MKKLISCLLILTLLTGAVGCTQRSSPDPDLLPPLGDNNDSGIQEGRGTRTPKDGTFGARYPHPSRQTRDAFARQPQPAVHS